MIALPGHVPRNLDIRTRTGIRMVSLSNSDRIKCFLELAQRDRMDEEPAVSVHECLAILYHHCHPGAAVLGSGNLCELYLFQQYQSDIHQNETS